jgi:hypothetical protein
MPLPPLPPGVVYVEVDRLPQPEPRPTESWSLNYSGPKSVVDDRFCEICSSAATGKCRAHGTWIGGCATCKAASDRECSGHAGFEATVSKRPDIPAHILTAIRAEVETLPEGQIEVEASGMKGTPELASRLKLEIRAIAKR